jgi:hypothetical protein
MQSEWEALNLDSASVDAAPRNMDWLASLEPGLERLVCRLDDKHSLGLVYLSPDWARGRPLSDTTVSDTTLFRVDVMVGASLGDWCFVEPVLSMWPCLPSWDEEAEQMLGDLEDESSRRRWCVVTGDDPEEEEEETTWWTRWSQRKPGAGSVQQARASLLYLAVIRYVVAELVRLCGGCGAGVESLHHSVLSVLQGALVLGENRAS